MTDIVERLRELSRFVHELDDENYPYAIGDGEADMCDEAADEIERLRKCIDSPEPDERRKALLDGVWRSLEEVEDLGLDATWISNAHLELRALYHEIERLMKINKGLVQDFNALLVRESQLEQEIDRLRAELSYAHRRDGGSE